MRPIRRVWLSCVILTIAGLGYGAEHCDLSRQKEERKNGVKTVVARGSDVNKIGPNHVYLTATLFPATRMSATTFSCSPPREVEHPKLFLYAWLTEIHEKAIWEFISVKGALKEGVGRTGGAYEISRGRLLDHRTGVETRIRPTIEFVGEFAELLFGKPWAKRLDVVVSAAYWKATEAGPQPLGLLKVGGNARGGNATVLQGYRHYSAQHVLCAGPKGGIELLSPTEEMRKDGETGFGNGRVGEELRERSAGGTNVL